MKLKNNRRGITLIALIITIIVLFILAGITYNIDSPNNNNNSIIYFSRNNSNNVNRRKWNNK